MVPEESTGICALIFMAPIMQNEKNTIRFIDVKFSIKHYLIFLRTAADKVDNNMLLPVNILLVNKSL